MPVFFYLCLDSYFLLVNLTVVSFFQVLITLYYKDQFLFIVCLPYLNEICSNTLLVNKFGFIVQLYALLTLLTLLLAAPVFLVISGLLFFLPVFDLLSTLFLLGISFLYTLILIGGTFCLFKVFLPAFLTILGSLSPKQHYLLAFTFDFTIDSWIYTIVALTVLSTFAAIFYIVFLVSLSGLSLSGVFLIRISCFIFFLLTLLALLPSDPYLHTFVLVFYILLTELPFFLCFLLVAYSGRVA
jgi:hypothetical protein